MGAGYGVQYDPPQDQARRSSTGAAQGVRGCATPVRQAEEAGGAGRTQGAALAARPQVLQAGRPRHFGMPYPLQGRPQHLYRTGPCCFTVQFTVCIVFHVACLCSARELFAYSHVSFHFEYNPKIPDQEPLLTIIIMCTGGLEAPGGSRRPGGGP